VITVVPRLTVGLGVKPGGLPCGAIWENTRIELPFLEAAPKLREIISGREVTLEAHSVALASLLKQVPAAVLVY